MAFDHRRILHDGVERARAKLEYTTLGAAFCRAEFTVAELRRVYEIVWGRALDPRNFHRKVTGAERFLVATGRPPRRATAGAPPALPARRRRRCCTRLCSGLGAACGGYGRPRPRWPGCGRCRARRGGHECPTQTPRFRTDPRPVPAYKPGKPPSSADGRSDLQAVVQRVARTTRCPRWSRSSPRPRARSTGIPTTVRASSPRRSPAVSACPQAHIALGCGSVAWSSSCSTRSATPAPR